MKNKNLKVLIAQKNTSDVTKIQELLKGKKLNLEIKYVDRTFSSANKKIDAWLPDIVITGQLFEDTYGIGNAMADTGYDIAAKKGLFESNPKVYLFSSLDVRDPHNLFDGKIPKRGGKWEQTLLPFLEKLSERKN